MTVLGSNQTGTIRGNRKLERVDLGSERTKGFNLISTTGCNSYEESKKKYGAYENFD